MATCVREVLLSPVFADKIPKLYETEYQPNPLLYVKLHFPDFHWAWYIQELSEDGDLCFGFVDGDYPERGYFLLSELLQETGPTGKRIERDLDFRPRRFREVAEAAWSSRRG